MRYVLNSAVITSEGRYDYRLIDYVRATEWLHDGEFISTVGYPETAEAMARLFQIEVPVNRTTIVMSPGDEALVFRLHFPPGTARPAPGQKGALSVEFLRAHSEVGILRRLK